MTPQPPRYDALLSELPWLRRLALKLTGNAHDADDLAQQASLQAWMHAERGHRPRGPVRSWLAAIARNLHRATHRADTRRTQREAKWTPVESPRSPADLSAHLDAHRLLLAAVDDLAEPYRSTITQHYLYGASVREIAARDGVPERTVETRLRRAREQLRGRLDRDLGSRSAWLALLGPMPVPPLPTPIADAPPGEPILDAASMPTAAAASGASATIAVTAKLLTTGAVVAVTAAAAAFLWWPESPSLPTGEPNAEVSETVQTQSSSSSTTSAPGPLKRVVAEDSRTATSPEPKAESRTLEILCLDPNGKPVAGLALRRVKHSKLPESPGVTLSGDEFSTKHIGITDPNGRLAAPADGGEGELAERHPGNAGWQMVLRPDLANYSNNPDGNQRVAIVAREVVVAGIVQSPTRQPLRQAQAEIVLPKEWQSRIPHVLSSGSIRNRTTAIGQDGRLQLSAPRILGAKLKLTATAHQPLTMPLPDVDRRDLNVTLQPVRQHWVMTGAVADAHGTSMAKIRVVSAVGSTTTDSNGLFRLEVVGKSPPERLHATGVGWQPASLDVPSAPTGSNEITGLHLVLADKSLTIRGRVLDADNQPIKNSSVWYESDTRLGWSGDFPVSAERRAAGTDLMWHRVQTDASGAFELTGLLQRGYVLHAACPKTTLETKSTQPIQAGTTDVELRLDRRLARPPVQGRIVDPEGAPIAGATVSVSRSGYTLKARDGHQYLSPLRGQWHKTDVDGRFTLEGLPREHDVHLSFSAGDFSMGSSTLAANEQITPLEIVLFRQTTMLVDLRDPAMGDAVSFEDADGKSLNVTRITNEMHYIERRSNLVGGRVTVKLAGNAVRAVLWKGDERVTTSPLDLSRGGRQTLQF